MIKRQYNLNKTGPYAACVAKLLQATRLRDANGAGGDGASAADAVLSATEAAEMVIGLLFAAGKNPAIGAGQTLLFLLDPSNKVHLDKVLAEVHNQSMHGAAAGAAGAAGAASAAVNADKSVTPTTGNAVEKETHRHLDQCITETLRKASCFLRGVL